jgi:hypothetical protein
MLQCDCRCTEEKQSGYYRTRMILRTFGEIFTAGALVDELPELRDVGQVDLRRGSERGCSGWPLVAGPSQFGVGCGSNRVFVAGRKPLPVYPKPCLASLIFCSSIMQQSCDLLDLGAASRQNTAGDAHEVSDVRDAATLSDFDCGEWRSSPSKAFLEQTGKNRARNGKFGAGD